MQKILILTFLKVSSIWNQWVCLTHLIVGTFWKWKEAKLVTFKYDPVCYLNWVTLCSIGCFCWYYGQVQTVIGSWWPSIAEVNITISNVLFCNHGICGGEKFGDFTGGFTNFEILQMWQNYDKIDCVNFTGCILYFALAFVFQNCNLSFQ